MTAIASAATGLWSVAATWNPAQVPVDGDSVTISSGHTVTVDVDQSAWPNGLAGLVITGTIRHHTGMNTALLMKGHISGSGSYYMGNSAVDPIGSAYTAKLQFNGDYYFQSGNIVNKCYVYGYNRGNWKAKLAANAASGQKVIVLDTDLVLASGELITIGSQVAGLYAENMIVDTYVAGTKTVTCTANLARNHYSPGGAGGDSYGDTVTVTNRNAIIEQVGAKNYGRLYPYGTSGHFEWCLFRNGGSSAVGFFYNRSLVDMTYCVFDGCYTAIHTLATGYIAHCIIQNSISMATIACSGVWNDCIFWNNLYNFGLPNAAILIGCLLQNGGSTSVSGLHASTYVELHNCVLQYHLYADIALMRGPAIWLNGTALNSSIQVLIPDVTELNRVVAHNLGGVAGNHRSWEMGGNVYRETTIVNFGPASLRLECLSATYRVWCELIRIPFKNGVQRTISFYVRKTVSMSAFLPRVYLVRSPNNPILAGTVSVELTPLATFTMGNDNNDAWVQVTGTYTHTSDEVLTLIAVAKNASGNVYFADPVVM